MVPAEMVETLRAALRGRADIRVAILFGSHARGTARPDSDVDIAVDAPSADMLELAAELSAAIGRDVDLLSLEDPGVPMVEELLRDGIVVHEAVAGAGAAWRSRTLTTMETDRPWFARMRDAWLARVAERGLSDG